MSSPRPGPAVPGAAGAGPHAPAVPDVPGGVAVAEGRRLYRDGKAALIAAYGASHPTAATTARLLRGLTRHVDGTLTQLWQCLMPGAAVPAALVAVGGYGRGELFPYSDIDVLVLLPDDNAAAAVRTCLESFISACWDIGLEIGSSVRTVAECLHEAGADVTVQTALLEARLVTGAPPVYRDLVARCRAAMDPAAFFVAKQLEMRQRHERFQDTPYALEPNCKESPGGLRDLQVLRWVAQAAGLGRSWAEMASQVLLTPLEERQLRKNEGVLKTIRANLHIVAGRREDRLIFDLQTALAQRFGLESTPTQRASEALMHRYYWTAKAVTQLNRILMLNIEERIHGATVPPMRRIDARFFDRDGMLEVADDHLYERDPHAILATFLTYQREVGIEGLSARTLRALYNARDAMDGRFRADPVNHATFMAILEAPSGQTHALRLMNQTSVLGRYLWVFRRIVGKMQHDLFHVYTVDQHILMVVRNMRRFFMPEHSHEYPFCSELAARWDKPWLLYVAALFHDVAKGRGGDHSVLGAREVRRFCRTHAIDAADTGLIEFLVREHLTMSHVAQKEDVSDPEVIAAFARKVGDERRLTALYLLTVADVRGTSPKVWNAWKGKLLEDCYRQTLRALGGAAPHVEATLEARKQDALALLALTSQLPGSEAEFWKTLQVGYFMRHDAAEVAWHTRHLARRVHTGTPFVRARVSPVGEGLQVLVYAPDQADLFARICGCFDSTGFSIQEAKVHTTTLGYALDTFQVIAPDLVDSDDDGAPMHRDLIGLVQTRMTRALDPAVTLPGPSTARVSRRVRSFPLTPRLSLHPDERAQHWLLSITASDRRGLLYALAQVLAKHRVNLELAKISTLGERVEDTFLVDGPNLARESERVRFETDLTEVLQT